MRQRIENLHDRPLSEMKPGETIYAMRNFGGIPFSFFGKLVRIEGGIVVINGRWLDKATPDKVDHVERFNARKCYLWGKDSNGLVRWPRCHWFKNGKKERAQ